ncbi:MAG: DUF4173 domain-containing protein [Clostridia bacterium]|nr:DUF4173 domain-containing protein [Clostridia bacterium]
MRKAVYGSLFLSILHSILFFGQDLGISVLLFAIPAVFLLIMMLKKHNKIKNDKALYLAIPILLLSSTYLFFNNEFFNVINMIAIPFLLGVMIVWTISDTFKIRTLFGKSVNLVIGSLEFIPNVLKRIKEALVLKKNDEEDKNKKIKQIGIGILCSLPLLIIILALLISADGIFANMFGELYDQIMYIFNVEFWLRIILIAIVFIYLVCIIYNIVFKESTLNSDNSNPFTWNLKVDGTIVNTVLTIINVVYLLFSSIQILYVLRYLFINPLSIAGDFEFAEYARQGFFQLMLVSFINFVIIIITNSNNKEKNIENKYTKIMNVLMSVFTIIIAVSAFMRMSLYEREYGYTFLRLMVYVVLTTEIIMIIPTIIYIIKGKFNIFKTYFIIAITMYTIVNFINIDATIARKNVNRYIEQKDISTKREIDFSYLRYNTGTDAIPEIVRLYNNVSDEKIKREINNYLYSQYNDVKEERNWQEFNISKQRAKDILKKINLNYIKYNYKNDNRYNDYL